MDTPTFHPKRDRRVQPRVPPHDSADIPEAGDVVVQEVRRDETLVYLLHGPMESDEHVFRSRGDAIARARAAAGRLRIRAWVSNEESDIRLLADFRVGTMLPVVVGRLRAEFREMPALRLTRAQVERLFGVERTVCQMALDALVDEQFLCEKTDGQYARVTDDPIRRPQPVKATLTTTPRFVRAS